VEKGLELSHSLIKWDDFFANVLVFMIYLQKCFKSDNYGNILDFVIDLQKGFYDNYDNILIFVIDLYKF
jgi:hypothetical protein